MVKPEILKQAQATREETKKIALEKRLLPEIRSVFSQMVTDYRASISSTGSVPRASDFQGEWNAIFLRHYRRVGRSFLPSQRTSKFYEMLLATKQELTPEENQTLILSFGEWSRSFGNDQSAFVTETNQNDYVTALQTATEEAPDGVSSVVLAAAAAVVLRRLFRARDEAIANVQTQAPAEEAKEEEAVALAVSAGKQEDETTKTWQTVGDTNVRVAHVAADGQIQTGNTAFTIGGESLRYPGDSSLGGSAGNTINCRCAAIWA